MHIGIEIDEARVTAVAVDDQGAIVARVGGNGSGNLAAAARSALHELRGSSSALSVGIASPSPDHAAVEPAVAALRTDAGSATVAVTASGTAAAFAESWIGAAKGAQDVVFFAVDEHASGGVVRGGAPLTGARGRAASVAWLALNPVEREDYRKIGCLEAEVAASGIVRRLIWRVKAGDRSRVQDAVNDDLSAITVEHVLTAARTGDGVAISVVRDTAKYLGMAAANLAAVVDPEALVLGGIMASAADLLFEPVRTEIGRRLPKSLFESLTIVPAALGSDAAAIGAARAAFAPRP